MFLVLTIPTPDIITEDFKGNKMKNKTCPNKYNNIIYGLDKYNNWVIDSIEVNQETKKFVKGFVIYLGGDRKAATTTKFRRLNIERINKSKLTIIKQSSLN